MLPPDQLLPAPRGRASLLALAVVALGLLASGLAGYSNYLQSQAHIRERFEELSRKTAARAEERINGYFTLLNASSALFAASTEVNRHEFRDFALSFANEEQFAGMVAMGYAPYLLAGNQARFLAGQATQAERRVTIRPQRASGYLAPVWFIEPQAGSNGRLLGYDLTAYTEASQAFDRARDTGHAALSGPVRLVEEWGPNQAPAVLMVVPIYRKDLPHFTLEQRRANIDGFVFVVVRLGELLAGMGLDAGVDLEIFDGAKFDLDRLLFDADQDRTVRFQSRPLEFTQRSELGGRMWNWYFGAMPGLAEDSHSWLAWLIGGGGALLALLLGGLVFVVASARGRAEVVAARMTQRYQERNQALATSIKELNYQKSVLDSHAIVATTDRNGTITYVNDLFCEASGYGHDELIGQNHRMMKSSRHSPEFFAELWATISTGQVWQGEICNLAKDGREIWLQTSIVPFMGEDGLPERYIAARTLITELRLHRDHLQGLVDTRTRDLLLAKEAAEAADQAKSEFLANMSHELRTPMHAILSYSELGTERLRGDTLPLDKLRAYFERIHLSGQRLLNLINDLLDLSKMEAGRMHYQMRRRDLGQVVEHAVGQLGSLFKGKRVQVRFVECHCRTEGVFDAARVEQVITNLLANAIRFSPEGGVIGIECGSLEIPGRRAEDPASLGLRVSVTDQGPGIPEAERELVFDKFVQASHSKSGAGGTGLGLAISREILHAHRGDIWAEAGPGGGTRMVFEFPADLPESAPD